MSSSGRGKRLALLAGFSGAGVLLASAAAFKDRAVEEWHLHRLRTGSEAARSAAVQSLIELGSLRALPLVHRHPPREPRVDRKAIGSFSIPATPLESLFRNAIRRHARRGPQVLATRILNVLGGCPGEVDQLACDVLARLIKEPTTAEVATTTLLSHADASIRLTAVATVMEMGPAAAHLAPALADALIHDPDLSVRRLAGSALGRLGSRDQRTTWALVKALKDPSPLIAWVAALSLGELRAAPAVPALLQSLQDPRCGFRPAALRALQRIGPDPRLLEPALRQAMEDGDATVRRAAAEVLEASQGR